MNNDQWICSSVKLEQVTGKSIIRSAQVQKVQGTQSQPKLHLQPQPSTSNLNLQPSTSNLQPQPPTSNLQPQCNGELIYA